MVTGNKISETMRPGGGSHPSLVSPMLWAVSWACPPGKWWLPRLVLSSSGSCRAGPGETPGSRVVTGSWSRRDPEATLPDLPLAWAAPGRPS